jgi:hypothetical protein
MLLATLRYQPMISSMMSLEDLQSTPQPGLGPLQAAFIEVNETEALDTHGQGRVIVTVDVLVDGEGSFVDFLCSVAITQATKHHTQVVEATSDLRVTAVEGLLAPRAGGAPAPAGLVLPQARPCPATQWRGCSGRPLSRRDHWASLTNRL